VLRLQVPPVVIGEHQGVIAGELMAAPMRSRWVETVSGN
jgi:hypothetical protein